ncbi:hypothetical protein TNCV_2484171 [Trichonephila clavipes]|uniref:Uncharacterized protein n=1 Tax=Trichonephila clavipes TaxID=2585209 RepID=A0A8X6VZ78_TRICX|nr:hypothetical protein TNCV_2484171 [Trichonephila clavipes]
MASLGHQSLHPTNLGRVDEEMVSPVIRNISFFIRVQNMIFVREPFSSNGLPSPAVERSLFDTSNYIRLVSGVGFSHDPTLPVRGQKMGSRNAEWCTSETP